MSTNSKNVDTTPTELYSLLLKGCIVYIPSSEVYISINIIEDPYRIIYERYDYYTSHGYVNEYNTLEGIKGILVYKDLFINYSPLARAELEDYLAD